MTKRERIYLIKKSAKKRLRHKGYLKLTHEFIQWSYTPKDYDAIYKTILRLENP